MRLVRCLSLVFLLSVSTLVHAADRPNVLLIVTDDQGYGDLGCHGNPTIRTPHLDRLAQQSVELTSFYVCPVCSPTRASLMTGRYNYRTGVVDTYLGRSLMYPDEVTLAEMFAAAGYRTGIFGKWHLGDNYPMRAIDQGFQEALVLKGGGIGQPSDPPGGSSYFDPVLQHNGKQVKTQGYCSDVFTDATLNFIDQDPGKPFFAYLAFNAPHTPLQVPEAYYQPYKQQNFDSDVTARIYGMVTNIDDNLGRLFARLDEKKLADNTIVIFLTDNGPQQRRYNAGLRGLKGTVYEGGIHVPCFVRWPSQLKAGRKVDCIAAHIDLAPTLLELCGVAKPERVPFDGTSLVPLLRGTVTNWPERTLFFQWHRGDEPQLYRACAARTQRWKLVQAKGSGAQAWDGKPRFELYDIPADPGEKHDVAGAHPDVAERLRRDYEAWFKDVSATRGYAPSRIVIGSEHENPTVLTRQDWRGPKAGWEAGDRGFWEIQVALAGEYEVTVHVAPRPRATVHLAFGDARYTGTVAANATACPFAGVRLPAGPGQLEAWAESENENQGALWLSVRRTK